MNTLMQIDLGNLLLFGILIAQVLILLRTPSNTSAHTRRQRKARVERVKEKYRAVKRGIKEKATKQR